MPSKRANSFISRPLVRAVKRGATGLGGVCPLGGGCRVRRGIFISRTPARHVGGERGFEAGFVGDAGFARRCCRTGASDAGVGVVPGGMVGFSLGSSVGQFGVSRWCGGFAFSVVSRRARRSLRLSRRLSDGDIGSQPADRPSDDPRLRRVDRSRGRRDTGGCFSTGVVGGGWGCRCRFSHGGFSQGGVLGTSGGFVGWGWRGDQAVGWWCNKDMNSRPCRAREARLHDSREEFNVRQKSSSRGFDDSQCTVITSRPSAIRALIAAMANAARRHTGADASRRLQLAYGGGGLGLGGGWGWGGGGWVGGQGGLLEARGRVGGMVEGSVVRDGGWASCSGRARTRHHQATHFRYEKDDDQGNEDAARRRGVDGTQTD